jgi:hypothetical protein
LVVELVAVSVPDAPDFGVLHTIVAPATGAPPHVTVATSELAKFVLTSVLWLLPEVVAMASAQDGSTLVSPNVAGFADGVAGNVAWVDQVPTTPFASTLMEACPSASVS